MLSEFGRAVHISDGDSRHYCGLRVKKSGGQFLNYEEGNNKLNIYALDFGAFPFF